jgi:hypothetical protein
VGSRAEFFSPEKGRKHNSNENRIQMKMRIENKAVPLTANQIGSMHHIGLRILQTPFSIQVSLS